MGLDFIKQRAATFTKSWDNHRVELATRTLFTREPDCVIRACIARRVSPEPLAAGAQLIVQPTEQGLSAFVENTRVADFVDPPDWVRAAVQQSANCALGEIVRTFGGGDVLEVRIC